MVRIGIIFLLALAGCKEIAFNEPQPKGRKSFSSIPRSLQGRYLAVEEDGSLSRDTIIVTATGYRFGYFDPKERSAHHDEYEEGVLSDSLVLKSYRGYYFLNIYEKPEWLLRVIRKEKSGDLTYMAMEQTGVDFDDYVKKLALEIRIDSVQLEDRTIYYIDPGPSELVGLIEKGFFSEARLKKIK